MTLKDICCSAVFFTEINNNATEQYKNAVRTARLLFYVPILIMIGMVVIPALLYGFGIAGSLIINPQVNTTTGCPHNTTKIVDDKCIVSSSITADKIFCFNNHPKDVALCMAMGIIVAGVVMTCLGVIIHLVMGISRCYTYIRNNLINIYEVSEKHSPDGRVIIESGNKSDDV